MASQNGEHLFLDGMLAVAGTWVPKSFVEIGASYQADGKLQCNLGHLFEKDWTGSILDASFGEWITAENVNERVPTRLGVLSIDIDGMDYWVWKGVVNKPAIVIIEYNAQLDPEVPLVVPYDPHFKWDGTSWFGASAAAMVNLAWVKGYWLVGDVAHVNLFFMRSDLLNQNQPKIALATLGGRIVGPDRDDPQKRKFVTP